MEKGTYKTRYLFAGLGPPRAGGQGRARTRQKKVPILGTKTTPRLERYLEGRAGHGKKHDHQKERTFFPPLALPCRPQPPLPALQPRRLNPGKKNTYVGVLVIVWPKIGESLF